MKYIITSLILLSILAPNGLILAQNDTISDNLDVDRQGVILAQNSDEEGFGSGVADALEPKIFFDRLFDFVGNQPVLDDAKDKLTGEGSFDEANEAIGNKIGVNPVDILKAFVRAIIWILESGVEFFGNFVD